MSTMTAAVKPGHSTNDTSDELNAPSCARIRSSQRRSTT